jgi:hypothetical protein
MTPPMLAQLLWVLIAAAAVGQPTEGVAVPATCGTYCRGYLAKCADSIAFATSQACEEACDGWRRTEVSCRVEILAVRRPSCIAAGPASPICGG